ncbi:MAG: class III poly(R)-hydroxyalkanoic acid synthase subunit PhaC [Firmicutes bacterium]|nr:class III poly(R)-hydroxyalkanoic acid synthase subunit PhaC [Bacillota bacterium]
MTAVPAPWNLKRIEEALEINRKLISGVNNLLQIKEVEVDPTPKEMIYQEDKMRLFHYQPLAGETAPVPTLVVYALVNRQYMMDLQSDRSVIRNWLELGLDLYIIDWGYPDQVDRYLTLEDYVDGYINESVDVIRRRTGQDKINLLGVCQGGTLSIMYAALYPEKVKNLVTMVTPFDFSTDDGLLFRWGKYMNVDKFVDTFGVVPGDYMNVGFMMLKPFSLALDKYVGLLDSLDDREGVEEFLRMEKWIFDSPGQAGETLRQFVRDLYQKNLLAQNRLELGGRRVDLRRISMPLLNVIAEQDHLVPPASSRPITEAVASEDSQTICFQGGHIGLFVSSKSQKEVAPAIARWLKQRSSAAGDREPGAGNRAKSAGREKRGGGK